MSLFANLAERPEGAEPKEYLAELVKSNVCEVEVVAAMSVQDNHSPWVEKFRPHSLREIILDKNNRTFFQNIVETRHLPHLLFYGPPGTGKTTTILSIIRQFIPEVKHEVLHLNASDDRGIDVIRNQILHFVHANTFYPNAIKFVVLDEVDNMTKNAQYGLTYLLQSLPMEKVRFCLICNYISKIVSSLKYEFVSIRFNQLPEKAIVNFLVDIAQKENVFITKKNIKRLCARFGSDIRSMINYMQTQYMMLTCAGTATNAINSGEISDVFVFDEVVSRKFAVCTSVEMFQELVLSVSRTCNCSIKEVLREYFMDLINGGKIDAHRLFAMEHVMHNIHTNMDAVNIRYVYFAFCEIGTKEANLTKSREYLAEPNGGACGIGQDLEIVISPNENSGLCVSPNENSGLCVSPNENSGLCVSK